MVRVVLPHAPDPLVVLSPDAKDACGLESIDTDALLALYRDHGAILLRGFAFDLAAFGRFCRALCPTAAINESPGREVLDGDHAIQTVNTGADPFPLHPELAREAWKPDTAFFACLSPPGAGGQTTICDGVELVRRLPCTLRDDLAARRLLHVFPTWPGLLEFWLGTVQPDPALLDAPPPTCPYRFRRLSDGRLVRLFTRPLLHRPMFAGELAFGNFLLFARDYVGRRDFPLLDDGSEVPEAWVDAVRSAAQTVEVEVAWHQGDILMLDNTRFMHGRRAIRDTAERRIATYFGYLSGAPRNPEEPPLPPWRAGDFAPPLNPALVTHR
ncbi:alpha-ketoglutarate-dependent taurine dioxygenase [Novosphingobium kunmingense]|uniref:Alpha-ketoglutarate-dependent taurine dioxygenase n=2 Tax=Novosphingobium kunmingense TaxID=1211806 RepID=A0A2N0H6W6_9SPHN|nr:alpha-ketoglutarate-dependent taurine dioxygenase [Novosphingobium kunmingense]